ncbi:MAG: hypothetical protein Q9173_005371 [Seirophora scorigena]
MAPSPKPDHHLNLNYLPQFSASQPRSGSSTANTSPIEAAAGSAGRSPFGNPSPANGMGSNTRLGAGSPSHEFGSRPFSKRAREIQAQEGLTPNLWGPPASGGSTPLRETIPESPSQDGFPDFMPPAEGSGPNIPRSGRSRAGTVPSRFSPSSGPGTSSSASLLPKTSRPTPSTSPYRSPSLTAKDAVSGNSSAARSTSALLSRLRAGSMPQQIKQHDNTAPFGTSLFSTGWGNGRERSSTLASVRSADTPDSPAHSSFSKDGLTDTDVKTLDYLGLAETPRQSQANLFQPGMQRLSIQPFIGELAGYKNANRFRSYSVNAKEKYAEDEGEDYYPNGQYSGQQSGAMTPLDATTAAALAATQAQIHQHNLAVQAFANAATGTRPRARTAGVLESPLGSIGRNNYLATPSRLDRSMTAADLGLANGLEYTGLPEAVRAMQLNNPGGRINGEIPDDTNQDGPTRALWLGNIPASTTVSSLQAIFQLYGKIESTRVLIHKNCGFVNFENVESAIAAKTQVNGKEIFPGAGPVRIGFAKAPSASSADTAGNNGIPQSRSPDSFTNGHVDTRDSHVRHATTHRDPGGVHAQSSAAALRVPELSALKDEMLQIVGEFGATNQDQAQIASSIDAAIGFDEFEAEIAGVPEPSHARIHDAPKLREIRKRIDNNAISQAEIEEIAIGMLPEIAELSSDYLGNTVVQKLFEFCPEAVKEQMLIQIDHHLAEIGVHKNGTWAAQKIIDVAKVPNQIGLIVGSLRPYTVALFLDQYGNYVLQCCLRFGFPWNNFIFETMLSRMWEVAQGRFGARAMRACLESHHATKDQQRMLAAAVALHSVQLATNANGALLLTWFLDTCTFPRRRLVLAPRLVPHLVHLCTHKVAYLTVLKVINQRNEPEARDTVLKALFFSENDQTLKDILSDQTCGATLIFKILTTPFLEDDLRADIVQNVRNVLNRLNIASPQAYKRLMDEVGISTRGGKSDRENYSTERARSQNNSRSASQQRPSTGRKHVPESERQYNGPYYQQLGQPQYPVHSVFPGTSAGIDPNGLAAYDQYVPGLAPNAVNPPLQQTFLATQARNMSQNDFYPGLAAPGLSGYNSAAMDPATLRAMQGQQYPRPMQMSGSPMLQQTGFGAPQGYNPLMAANGMTGAYQYPMQLGLEDGQASGQGAMSRVSNGRDGEDPHNFQSDVHAVLKMTVSDLKVRIENTAKACHAKTPGLSKLPFRAIAIIIGVASVNALIWLAVGIVIVSLASLLHRGRQQLMRLYSITTQHCIRSLHSLVPHSRTQSHESSIVIITSIAVAATAAAISSKFGTFERVGGIIEIALLGIASIQGAKGTSIWLILIFPVLFTAGMCLLDTVDGALMMAMYTSTALAKDRIAILYYSIVLTVVTVIVAVVIGFIQLLSLIQNVAEPTGRFWEGVAVAGDHYDVIGGAICGSFVVFGAFSMLLYKPWRRWFDEQRSTHVQHYQLEQATGPPRGDMEPDRSPHDRTNGQEDVSDSPDAVS